MKPAEIMITKSMKRTKINAIPPPNPAHEPAKPIRLPPSFSMGYTMTLLNYESGGKNDDQ
jgi:hypothetical protein